MSVRLTNEEAATLYRLATGSDFAPSVESVEAGALPSSAHDVLVKLREAGLKAPAEAPPAEEKPKPSLSPTARRTA